jgi:hypothetical protein
MDNLSIGGAPVTIGGETIDFSPPPGFVEVSAQAGFVAMAQPGLGVSAQAGFVAMAQPGLGVSSQVAFVALFPVPTPPPSTGRRRQYQVI